MIKKAYYLLNLFDWIYFTDIKLYSIIAGDNKELFNKSISIFISIFYFRKNCINYYFFYLNF